MNKVPRTDYVEIAEMFNRDGHNATCAYIADRYGVRYPDNVLTKIRKDPAFEYDAKTKRFTETASNEADQLFMTLDELCSPMVTTHVTEGAYDPSAASSEAMDRLVRTLISDRLLELSKYILLDTVTRTIIVDRSSMASDGYKVMIH